MNLIEKQASLQNEALEILSLVKKMGEMGATEVEIEARIEQADRLIEESKILGNQIVLVKSNRTLSLENFHS